MVVNVERYPWVLTQGGDGHNQLAQQLGKVRVEKIERINFIHA